MPSTYYLDIRISGRSVDLSSIEDFPLAISYKLEDKQEFQVKETQSALSVKVPATTNNDVIFNTFHNPAVLDLTPGAALTALQPISVVAGGSEVIVGKCILTDAEHSDRPLSYEFDVYGGNGDWVIDLKETTLYDCLKQISFIFTKTLITSSWAFDGTDPSMPYVFAPVRYRDAMDDNDTNMPLLQMKPALSKYWILYWGFKLAGYRLQSEFFDTPYFRRQVMPWTWGNFLNSDGTQQDVLRFLAKSPSQMGITYMDYDGFVDSGVTNDSTDGAFDNSDTYHYDAGNQAMTYTYPASSTFGTLEHHFYINASIHSEVTAGCTADFQVYWYVNGVELHMSHLVHLVAPTIGRDQFIGPVEEWFTTTMNPGDVLTVKTWIHTDDTSFGSVFMMFTIDDFDLAYTTVPMGGTIHFENLLGLKKWKFLDLLRGVVDEFNLQVGTDSIQKVVTIEPLHPYALDNDFSTQQGGYLRNDWLDWNAKQDLSKTSKLPLYKDSERELLFRFREDNNDGLLKKVQDRKQNTLGMGKYVLPQRFKTGRKEIDNRFFSPTMHYQVDQWKAITGTAPQMVAMVPENLSGTSNSEAENTFQPKSCYYKGLVADRGWRFDGDVLTSFPFMFAVNYESGGENDPILSYSDEQIGPDGGPYNIGKGLLRRFYLQRMANMREGRCYNTYFHLQNVDVQNWLHREHIVCRGDRWELVEINDYKPLKSESTAVFLRKWAPVTAADSDAVFPALISGLTGSSFQIKYGRLMCLSSDIPTV